VWQTEDGLPQNTVTAAVQTHDGYLWFGTNSGLARFDGERFQVFSSANTPELHDRRISSLYEDANGMLWIGQETGSLMRYREGRFESVDLAPRSTNDKIVGIGGDERGRLWIMRQSGVVDSLDGVRLPSFGPAERPSMLAWTRNAEGNIWLFEDGRAARLDQNHLSPITLDQPRLYEHVGAIAAAADGGLWVMRDERIRKWKDGAWVEDRGDYPKPYETMSTCLELRDGTLAIGTVRSGLYLVFGDKRPTVHLDHTNGLPQDWVRFLYEDREDNLWIGTGTAGLAAVHTTPFTVLNPPDRWQDCSPLAVAPGHDNSLWVGTEGGGLYHSVPGGWEHYRAPEGLNNVYIWAVTETPKGDVWAGSYWWGGPYRLQDGRFVAPPTVDPQATPVLALQADLFSEGLLIGRRDGLQRLDDSGVKWLIKAEDIDAADVTAIAQDSKGATWCGFNRGGVVRIADGKVTTFHRKDGLASDSIQCLLADNDGTLWIGTADNGLTRLKDGRFVNLGPAQGLADNAICHILDDGLGHFWLSTHHGIQRISKEELNRCADGQSAAFTSQKYDHNDGLPLIEFAGDRHATGCRTVDGRLWFASSKGVVGIDPRRIQVNTLPPPVMLESLLVDGEQKLPNASRGLESLPPDHQRLEFRFSGLSYVAPNKVAFKYRLDGIDRTWIDAGTKRTAFYSQLPAGDYCFRVIASNNDGVWNPEGAALEFTVQPFFWETWWFSGSCALGIIAGVAVLVRYTTRRRMQRRMEQLERQRELDQERTRIAQDIHDDIGTSLIRIAMFSQPERVELDQPQQTAATLSRIYTTAREMTRALDEIVWAIDPRHDTLDSLVGYMGMFAQELLGVAHLRCRLDVPVDVPAWPLTAEIRHNLFLAFKETLNNVVKHAAAAEVRIRIEVHERHFVLSVSDDGKGFDCSQPPSGSSGRIASGNGLRNIEKRITRIGGRCEISSQSGKGTSTSFIVPVQVPATAAAQQTRNTSDKTPL
jgi:ligand-binding sensor domain-containing protein/signal transduction histidine kinase